MNAIFYTLGCKVNQYETQAMRELMEKNGFTSNKDLPADAVIINSCTVTAESDRKTRQLLNRARAKYPKAVITLTGCSVEAFPEKCKALPADVIIGNLDTKNVVLETIKAVNSRVKFFGVLPHSSGELFTDNAITRFDERTRAYMKIEDGCDRFCSYCIIPYARGRVRSRSIESIISETQNLAKNGYKEIVLVGINLSAFGKENGSDLADAVDAVCSVEGILRVRLGSLEPDHITDEMLKRFKAQEKFCPQFHLSLQSGCNSTLKRMNRHYTAEFYLDLITRIKNTFTDAAITTDIMVGFAGETETEFAESLAFVRKAAFSRAHIFCYSRREGTVAAALKEQVTNAEKQLRSKKMQEITENSEKEFLNRHIGKTMPVLFETNNEGYTANYLRVKVNRSIPSGEIREVYIKETADGCLLGEIKE